MNQDVWWKIAALDLSSVRTKLLSRKGFLWKLWNNIDRIESEYRQFLYLIAANPGKTVVPWSEP